MDKANGKKRKTFSPSSIEQAEQDTYSCLCGSENRYAVSDEWKVQSLVYGNSCNVVNFLHNLTSKPKQMFSSFFWIIQVVLIGLYRWTTFASTALGCAVLTRNPIYAHQLMEESIRILANMPMCMPGCKAPRGSFAFVSPSNITCCYNASVSFLWQLLQLSVFPQQFFIWVSGNTTFYNCSESTTLDWEDENDSHTLDL